MNKKWNNEHFQKLQSCADKIADWAQTYEGDDTFTPVHNILKSHFPFRESVAALRDKLEDYKQVNAALKNCWDTDRKTLENQKIDINTLQSALAECKSGLEKAIEIGTGALEYMLENCRVMFTDRTLRTLKALAPEKDSEVPT